VLTDLVRSYTTEMQSVVPAFLAASFDMLRDGQSKMMENLGAIPNPLAAMPGFEAMRKSQEALMKTMMAGLPMSPWPVTAPKAEEPKDTDELAQIKKQLAELQSKLSKL
jgi:polyhydroxyalkanoate synthesis regulator protein